MKVAESQLTGVLKVLSEPTRLRILALLDREELSVGELAESLGWAQSRVSNHLRLLRESDLLAERHDGPSTFLRLAPADPSSLTGRLWHALRGDLAGLPEHGADLVRLEGVLAKRRRTTDFFDRLAGEWDKIAGDFETGQAKHRTVSHLLPPDFTVADLGCGTGYMASALLGQCTKIICVDRSRGMLDEAAKRLQRAERTTSLEFRCGELDALPVADGEVDGAIAGMVLHHLADLDRPLSEMRRILKPGGTAAVLELAPHREEWMRKELGDRHLGLEPKDVVSAFQHAGFMDVTLDPIEDRFQPRHPNGKEVSLALFVVRGRVGTT